jgi:hypothetical protein
LAAPFGKLRVNYYYEHIIRNEQEYARIARYIENNPLHWMMDEENKVSGNRLTE